MSSSAIQPPADTGHRFAWAIAIPLFVLGELLLFGHKLGLHNHAIQLPYLFWLHDPSLYPGDRMMESMREYFSYFWLFVAWVTRLLPLEPTFLTMHVLTLVARYGGLWWMTRLVAPEQRAAPWIVCWVHLWTETPIGRESLHWFYLTHTAVAFALGLWTLCFALRGWWWAAFAVAGIVFDLHAMQGAYLAMMLGIGWLWVCRRQISEPRILVRGLCLTGVFLLAAFPGLVWMLRSGAVNSGGGSQLGDLLKAFFPGHFFPSAFTAGNWVSLAGYLLLGALAIRWSRNVPARTLCLAMIVSLLVFWLVAGILIETVEPAILLKLHVYRSSSYFVVLVLVLVGGWLAMRLGDLIARSSAFTIPAFAFVVFAPTLMTKPNLLMIPWFLGITLGAFITCWGLSRIRAIPSLWAGVPAALLLAVGLIWLAVVEHTERIGWNAGFAQRMEQYDKAATWARENTPTDARFLTPPDLAGFRVTSQRPVVFEWFDGAAMLWDAEYCDYWQEHYLQAGAKFYNRYSDFITDRLKWTWYYKPYEEMVAIAHRENAQYIVHYRELWKPIEDRPIPWPDAEVVYDDGEDFFVVRVPEK